MIMGYPDKSEVASSLATMSSRDYYEVVNRAKALRSIGSGSASDVSSSDKTDLVLEAISTTLRGLGVEHCSIVRMKSSTQYPTFVDEAGKVLDYMGAQNMRRVQLVGVLQRLVELLYKDLCNNGVPVKWDRENHRLIRRNMLVGSRELMIFIGRLPQLSEKHFPGYSRAGLLSWLIRAE